VMRTSEDPFPTETTYTWEDTLTGATHMTLRALVPTIWRSHARPERNSRVGRADNSLGRAHGGVVDASYGSGLSFRDPDNIALAFFARPGT
jgi:hypothetical protein